MRRTLLATAVVTIVLLSGCGGSMSATEYVDELNVLVEVGRSEFEAAVADYDQIADPTLAESVAFIEREVALRQKFLEGFDALDPPESLVFVHQALGDVMRRLVAAAEGLVVIAGTVSSVDEAEETPEFAEYRAANDDGNVVCLDIQAKLDEMVGAGEVFADTPWIPDQLFLSVQAFLECGEIETG